MGSKKFLTSTESHVAVKYAFVLPAIALLITLNVFPLFYNVALSFTDAVLTRPDAEFVGVKNYTEVFSNPDYRRALNTTATFVVATVAIELLLGFGLALVMKDRFVFKTFFLMILLVPMMLSPAVMGFYWFLILNSDYGILNQVLEALGLPQPAWLSDFKLLSIILIDVWMWTPFMILIALAGLNAIPSHLYEAAEIDRASRWTVFRRITLPMCAPFLVLATLFRTTDSLKQFDLIMALIGPTHMETQTLSVMLYERMDPATSGKIGIGAAYACIVLVLVIALACVFTRYIDWIQRRQGKPAT